jgi:AraC-like DNA-binding protein
MRDAVQKHCAVIVLPGANGRVHFHERQRIAMKRQGDTVGALVYARPDPVLRGRAAMIRAHIDCHLNDPSLSPATAAASLRIGVRTLHAALASQAESFGVLVRRLRLEECRATLLADPGRPVTDIAFASGFNSLPTFYRTFHAGFGMAPGDLRARHASRRNMADGERFAPDKWPATPSRRRAGEDPSTERRIPCC